MLKRNLFVKFGSLLLVALMLVGFPTLIYAAANDTWQPASPPTGTGSLVFINHGGKGHELIVDLAGTLYQVPEKTNDIPGRLQINLAPGTYSYAASIAHVGTANRTVEVVAGRVTGLSFVPGDPEVVVHNNSDDSDEKHTYRTRDKFTELQVYQEDLTDQVQ